LFNVYFYSHSQFISAANGDLISGLKMAEYFDQVNPLMIHRSAALDIDPFDRAAANADDERPPGGHGDRRSNSPRKIAREATRRDTESGFHLRDLSGGFVGEIFIRLKSITLARHCAR
jgi:hypothetical protein